MKERSRVELFERIRRDARDEGLSIRTLAVRHHVHRRLVRQALAAGERVALVPHGAPPLHELDLSGQVTFVISSRTARMNTGMARKNPATFSTPDRGRGAAWVPIYFVSLWS